jgi:hypothetical protein
MVNGCIEAFLMLYPDMRKSNNVQSRRVCRSSLDDISMVDQTKTPFPEVPAVVISSRTAEEGGIDWRRRGRLLYVGISMSAFRRLSARESTAGWYPQIGTISAGLRPP